MLVSTLVNNSHNIYDYYTQLGIDLSHVGLLGGHSKARTHRPEKDAVGYHLDSHMFNVVKKIKSITYKVNSTVNEFFAFCSLTAPEMLVNPDIPE